MSLCAHSAAHEAYQQYGLLSLSQEVNITLRSFSGQSFEIPNVTGPSSSSSSSPPSGVISNNIWSDVFDARV